ncbi:hypothetical protein [Aureibacillus halotolerans]|uniref:Uncharacterized protein n=1 Tax=Aureibacillus halotolerans TaxID=1508390 RepID=A0A4V3D659_9BACI|nr:hypothetical protein [Aureibacillus halotolerans]TDQ42707.1 hypothetical protein EV213_101136 [Aureibacillus halotolerans]
MLTSKRFLLLFSLLNLTLILGVQQVFLHLFNSRYEGVMNTLTVYVLFLLICTVPYTIVALLQKRRTASGVIGVLAATVVTMLVTNGLLFLQAPSYSYASASELVETQLTDGETLVAPPVASINKQKRHNGFRDMYAFDYLLYSEDKEGNLHAYQVKPDTGDFHEVPVPLSRLQAAGWTP